MKLTQNQLPSSNELVNIRIMNKQVGAINVLIIPMIVLVLFVIALSFSTGWFYLKYNDYYRNSQSKINEAVTQATQEQKILLEADFQEQFKKPYKNYTAPATASSISITFPKTWSAYVVEKQASSGASLDGYMHPNFIPDTKNKNNKFALRFTLETKTYASQVEDYQKIIEKGEAKSKSYKINGVKGVWIEGLIETDTYDYMVMLPVRDKTLKIWTEGNTQLKDFTDIILSNLSFSP